MKLRVLAAMLGLAAAVAAQEARPKMEMPLQQVD